MEETIGTGRGGGRVNYWRAIREEREKDRGEYTIPAETEVDFTSTIRIRTPYTSRNQNQCQGEEEAIIVRTPLI